MADSILPRPVAVPDAMAAAWADMIRRSRPPADWFLDDGDGEPPSLGVLVAGHAEREPPSAIRHGAARGSADGIRPCAARAAGHVIRPRAAPGYGPTRRV